MHEVYESWSHFFTYHIYEGTGAETDRHTVLLYLNLIGRGNTWLLPITVGYQSFNQKLRKVDTYRVRLLLMCP